VSPNGFVGPSSPNWSGYEAPVANVSLASAEWNVPSVDGVAGPGTVTATSSIWPGIGEGFSNDELIQAGTEQDQLCFNVAGECAYSGNYYPWFEMFPAENQEVVTNLQVRPGDLIGVNVGYDPDLAQSAQFLICNLSLNQCVSTGQTSPAPPSGNAEWVTERTGLSGVLPPLAHYQGAVVFTDTVTDTGFTPTGIGTAPPSTAAQDNATSITMHDCNGNTLSQPSALESTGSFGTVWQRFGGTNC
jgi:hypothetical protein